ncbi:chaperone NapD [Noviherbaspirillum sp. CPCC 100848]|uniref:Chaperone NapD n=1 Tax=Noviherbaspirillum album TaxID=3080276 RepID=A0ABU6JJ08_9BURK|nr:chaperone NapD [Noviherbaspirillum sp. CPCC 100848]MEC4723646.1 chaperone NapD [Noviherbaspirillum sp. CPCC 100848]
MEPELHIAGIVVFSNPANAENVAASIRAIPAATIFVVAPDGKIVVTLEAESTKRTLDYMDAIRVLPGVIDVAMVYQHAEPVSAFEEEIE